MLDHSIIKFLGLEGPLREITLALREALLVFIGDHNLQEQKKQILDINKCFIEFLEHISSEFKILKDLMHAWYYILSLAYQY